MSPDGTMPPDVGDDVLRRALTTIKGLSRRFARRHPGMTASDFESIGDQVIAQALARYDAERGPFIPFVYTRARYEMCSHVERELRLRDAGLLRIEGVGGEMVRRAGTSSDEIEGEADDGDADQVLAKARKRAVSRTRLRAFTGALAYAAPTAEADLPADELLIAQQEREQARRALHEAVAALPARESRFVAMFFWGGQPFTAIAAELGLSTKTIQRMLGRVPQKLERELAKRGVLQAPPLGWGTGSMEDAGSAG